MPIIVAGSLCARGIRGRGCALVPAALLLLSACGGPAGSAGWDPSLTPGEKIEQLQVLAQQATPEAVAALTEATREPDIEVRVEAVRALGKTHRLDALPAIAAASGNEVKELRHGVAWAVGEIGSKDGLPILEPLLKDPEFGVRAAAIGSIAKIRDPAAVPLLVNVVLKDPQDDHREMGVRILALLNDRSAIQPLEEALRSETNATRSHAATALGSIGDASCVPSLSAALEDFDPVVRGSAARALQKIGDPSAVPAIRKRAEAETEGIALASMAGAVVRLVGDTDQEQRSWAIGAIEKVLDDVSTDEWARAQAAAVLGELNSCASRKALKKALNDRKGVVRDAASKALAVLDC